jgi:alkanesulfonate monooxygenase SsuD/methylene tetrahydromethanopterin reductase-like flavin-dependent oxidoreductase (luciferase family)
VLGAVAAVTERVGLMTMVTCPVIRYHPAGVAQKAATMGLPSDGRFTLGLGPGERINEHVVGRGWSAASVRHEMLTEAVEIIRLLWEGGYVDHRGTHFAVEDARVFDQLGDGIVATEPDADLVDEFRQAHKAAGRHGTRSRCVGAPTPTRRSSGPTTRSAGRHSGGRSRPSCPTP